MESLPSMHAFTACADLQLHSRRWSTTQLVPVPASAAMSIHSVRWINACMPVECMTLYPGSWTQQVFLVFLGPCKCLSACSIIKCQKGGDAWRCVCRYPVMHGANDKGNGRETVAQRVKGTGSEHNRDLAWEDLRTLDGTKRIPADLRKHYR